MCRAPIVVKVGSEKQIKEKRAELRKERKHPVIYSKKTNSLVTGQNKGRQKPHRDFIGELCQSHQTKPFTLFSVIVIYGSGSSEKAKKKKRKREREKELAPRFLIRFLFFVDNYNTWSHSEIAHRPLNQLLLSFHSLPRQRPLRSTPTAPTLHFPRTDDVALTQTCC